MRPSATVSVASNSSFYFRAVPASFRAPLDCEVELDLSFRVYALCSRSEGGEQPVHAGAARLLRGPILG